MPFLIPLILVNLPTIQNIKFMESVLLNSFYKTGDMIGNYSAYGLTIIGVILLIWVMYKYLDTSDLK